MDCCLERFRSRTVLLRSLVKQISVKPGIFVIGLDKAKYRQGRILDLTGTMIFVPVIGMKGINAMSTSYTVDEKVRPKGDMFKIS